MPLQLMKLRVYYEDGREEQVTADQRDSVIFERVHKMGVNKALDEMTVTFLRWVAYQALVRTGRIVERDLPRKAWENSVIAVQDDDAEDESPLEVGQPDTSAEI